ncbi:hypothetical protein ACLB2K_057895 [Fragaria x ananassa]
MENDGSVPAITVDQSSNPCEKFTGESSMGNKKLNTETIIKELEGHIEYMKKLKETIGTTKDASIEAEIKNLEKMTEIMKGKVPGEDDKEAREAIESHVKMIREEGELKGCMSWLM